VEVEPGLLLISIKLYFNSTISLITIIGDILEKYWRYIGDVLEMYWRYDVHKDKNYS
jgi:hypothetical protein